MSNLQYIYSLSCPYTLDIKYIGRTNNPKIREAAHRRLPTWKNKPLTKRDRWITDILLNEKYPIFNIVETCNNQNASEREKFWINKYNDTGNLVNQIVIIDDSEYHKRISDKKEQIRISKIKPQSALSEYEQHALNKLGQSIHEGKWSNDGLVQLIELCKDFLNPVPMQEYANKHGITYNGLKKQNKAILLFNQKFIIDNQ